MSAERAGAVNRISQQLVLRVFEQHSGGFQPEDKNNPVFDFDGHHTSRYAECSHPPALLTRIKDVNVLVMVLQKNMYF